MIALNRKIIKFSALAFFLLIRIEEGRTQPVNPINNDLQLTIEVKNVDSQFILVPSLKVIRKDRVIQIYKRLYFGNEQDPFDYIIYLKKKINGLYVNLYREMGVRTRVLDDDWYELRNFTYGDTINVEKKNTANLDYFCPLEVNGEYEVTVRFYYYVKGKRYSIDSEPYYFKAHFRPKNSMWGNN